MEKTVRTVEAAVLTSAQMLGKSITQRPNTTLNQRFELFQNETPVDTDVFRLKYIGVGVGGHQMQVGTYPDNKLTFSVPVPLPHTARHKSLYQHIPLVMRPLDDDLTPAERLQYRMRVLLEFNNVIYACYYLRVVDLSQTTPSIETRTTVDGVVTSVPYSATTDDLFPTPPKLGTGVSTQTSSVSISVTSRFSLSLTAADMDELKNSAQIIYGDSNYAIISEMCTVAGIDRVVNGTFAGGTLPYTEVVSARVTHFLSTFFSANFNNAGITTSFDLGSVEPLLVFA